MFRWIRKLYDWVLSWANTPYGAVALAILAFSEASFFPIPPDVLLIALCVGQRQKALWFAGVCAIASLFGGAMGYLIGWGFWEATHQFFFTNVPGFTEGQFARAQALYTEYDFWIVFVAAFTPIPYKIITITAGVCVINFPMFMIASVVGRSARFFLVATLIYFFGAPIRNFIEARFNTLTVLFVILLVGGFIAIERFGHEKAYEAPIEEPGTPAVTAPGTDLHEPAAIAPDPGDAPLVPPRKDPTPVQIPPEETAPHTTDSPADSSAQPETAPGPSPEEAREPAPDPAR
ncbi:MAG: VTT domain-containing protein [Candidatus Hydrogenedentota bacterium]